MTDVFKHEILLDHDHIERADFGLPMHWFHVHDNQPGWEVPNHWHEELEISFTIQGSLKGFTVRGKTFDTKPGQIIIVRPGEAHSLANQVADPERDILTVYFDSKILLEDIPNIKQLQFHPHPEEINVDETNQLREYLLTLHKYITEPMDENLKQLSLKRSMYNVLYQIVSVFGYEEESQNEQMRGMGMSSSFMQEVLQFIKTHIQEDLRVQDLAEEFNISASYLTRSFKRYLDRTPMAYIQMLRLNMATQYLLNTDHAVQYIADLSGFGSLRSFERAFKEQFGCTPTEYRRDRKINAGQ